MAVSKRDDLVIAGDIGGTKTNVGLFRMEGTRPLPEVMESYPSRHADSLEDILSQFTTKHSGDISSACFGIAGPVKKGFVKTTNLPWVVSASNIQDRFGWESVSVINDLSATALGIPLLHEEELYPLNQVPAPEEENLGLMAPGTGLGQALLVWHEERYVPVASEGGHIDFAPRDEKEFGLWTYLREEFGRVSVERVVSGPGLYSIYQWLRDSGPDRESQWLRDQIDRGDPPRVVTEAAMERQEPLCLNALDTFVGLFGAAAGNLALTGLTRGGMYLGGGIAPRILSRLAEGAFMEAFTGKGRFSDLVSQIPVKVILNDRTALLGAAWQAFQATP
jgi:glucokinase